MLYFGRVGSSWGHCTFFGSSWGKKVITPKKRAFLINHETIICYNLINEKKKNRNVCFASQVLLKELVKVNYKKMFSQRFLRVFRKV